MSELFACFELKLWAMPVMLRVMLPTILRLMLLLRFKVAISELEVRERAFR